MQSWFESIFSLSASRYSTYSLELWFRNLNNFILLIQCVLGFSNVYIFLIITFL